MSGAMSLTVDAVSDVPGCNTARATVTKRLLYKILVSKVFYHYASGKVCVMREIGSNGIADTRSATCTIVERTSRDKVEFRVL